MHRTVRRDAPPPPRATSPTRSQSLLYTATALAFFMINTLMPVVKPEAYHAVALAGSQLPSRTGAAASASAPKHYLVLAAAGMQYAIMWWLGHASDMR